MTFDPEIHHRRSIRLKNYDYSQEGAYFITLCTFNRECLLSTVIEGQIVLNDRGKLVEKEWLNTAAIRDYIELDEFIIMPNHLHGIIIISNSLAGMGTEHCAPTGFSSDGAKHSSDGRGTEYRAPTREAFGKPTSHSIPTIIRSFKATTTRQVNEMQQSWGSKLWQKNYYERIIRNEIELDQIRNYIINNTFQWETDQENPFVTGN